MSEILAAFSRLPRLLRRAVYWAAWRWSPRFRHVLCVWALQHDKAIRADYVSRRPFAPASRDTAEWDAAWRTFWRGGGAR